MRKYFVYILANKKNGTLYTGVTDNLIRRIIEHKEKLNKGFASKYNIDKLVYFENYKYIDEAIKREKCIKRWKREWKIELIESINKEWKDLIYDITNENEIEVMRKRICESYGIS